MYKQLPKIYNKPESFWGVTLKPTDLQEIDGKKVSVDLWQFLCKSKTFADIATVGGRSGKETVYIEHNLFHQNTHVAVFNCYRDVMQITTLIIWANHLGPDRSWLINIEMQPLLFTVICWLVDTNRQSTTLLYEQLILILKTNYGQAIETFKVFGRWTRHFLYSSNPAFVFPQLQKLSVLAVVSKKMYPVSMRVCKFSTNMLGRHLTPIRIESKSM